MTRVLSGAALAAFAIAIVWFAPAWLFFAVGFVLAVLAVNEVVTLEQAGARHFLVWTAPDLGLTPAIRSLGPGAMALATSLAWMFNTQRLLPTVHTLDQASDDIDIAVLDAFTLLQQINAHPANFGLTNTTTACVTPSQEPCFCQTADECLFWDGIHPTRAAPALVAHEAARVLAQ